MIQQLDPAIEADKIEKSTESMLATFKGLSFDDAIEKLANMLVSFGFKLMIAILVFYLGKFIISKIYRTTQSIMIRRNVDASLTTFVLSLIKMTFYFILIIIVIGILGIETSSFIALFASAGVAIGMALSGTLQNFAGGVLILLLKPYKVGDYIEAQGYAGTVKSINIFNTIINTPDNKSIIIPNGGLSTSSVNNYSLEGYRRVDWSISLSYSTDFDKAAEAIKTILLDDDRVVKQYVEDDAQWRLKAMITEDRERLKAMQQSADRDESAIENLSQKITNESEAADGGIADVPEVRMSWFKRLRTRSRRRQEALQRQIREKMQISAGQPVKVDCAPFVALGEMADSSINLTVRAWTPSRFYWPLFFDMNRRFFVELPKQGFEFPFPQLDVHMQNHS